MQHSRQEITETIDNLWEMYDEEMSQGNTSVAETYASKAFQLLGSLPENAVFLSTKH